MLKYTSWLFATVAVHAWACGVPTYHYVFQLVTILSSLVYNTHNVYIEIMDTFMAHAAFCLVMLDVPTVVTMELEWLLLFPTAVAALWLAELLFHSMGLPIHCVLHVVAVVGANLFVHFLHSKC